MDGVAEILSSLVNALWMGAIAATPVGLLVGLLCRSKRIGPATRHVLWCAVLASFVTPVLGSWIWRPQWFRSDRISAAAEAVLPLPDSKPSQPASPSAETTSPFAEAPVALVVDRPSQRSLGSAGRLSGDELRKYTAAATHAATSAAVPGSRQVRAPEDPKGSAAEPCEATGPVAEKCSDPCEADLRESSLGSSAGDLPIAPAPALIPQNTDPRAGTTAWLDGFAEEARAWLAAVLRTRDAIVAVPPIPAALWFGGAVLLLLIGGLRTVAASRYLRRGRPASPEVRALVRQVADTLGLARAPETLMVDYAVSPMIWCGLCARLILPTDLWKSLDHDSRRAVIVHELAHLRRWDHVFWWVQSGIGALYWWHPIAWWARRRLNDEAEASCDAWVTSLFPSSRKAYASALVVTKSYLSNGRGMGPALGITSGSAKKLARRITMVMTQRTAPRMSVLGGCVAAIVVALGTFVTPGLACPPEEGAAKVAAEGAKVKAAKGVKARAPKAAGQHKSPEGVQFFGEAPALEAMKGVRAPSGLTLLRSRTPQSLQGAPAAPSQPVDLEALKEGRELREYPLPDGKLDALFEFMSRNDVPILVERHEDGIGIWANDAEHEIFDAFFKIVNPKGRSALPAEQYEELARAQVLDAERAGAQNAQTLRRYRSALEAMTRDRAAMERSAEEVLGQAEHARERADQMRELVDQLREGAGDMADSDDRAALEVAMARLRDRSAMLNSESESLDKRVEELERQMENLERQLEKLDEQLENLRTDDEGVPIGSVELVIPEFQLNAAPHHEVILPPMGVPAFAPVVMVAPTAPAPPTPIGEPAPAVAPVAPIAPVAPVAPVPPAPSANPQ